MVPRGATAIDPAGTAPGLIVPAAKLTVIVLPGPPRELQAMWPEAISSEAAQAVLRRATPFRNFTLRLFGIPESEIASTLRAAETEGLSLEPLEITTCLRRGEIEVMTRYQPSAEADYAALTEFIRDRHRNTLFSQDGRTIDELVATLLEGHTIAVAESCTGGLFAGRLTDRPGSSGYFAGGIVPYSNQAKSELVGIDPELIERFGAVSPEVAEALADGAMARFGADLGVGITGIAGPEGGTEEKPVGLVCFSMAARESERVTRSVQLPGGRADVRDRATTVAMHLLRRLLQGESATELPSAAARAQAGAERL
jgi:nicotinamide-nucleotide amidase